MNFQPYRLDEYAHNLVLKYSDRDVLNETHKMRMTVAYGLERFWGEQFRLEKDNNEAKAQYWQDTWKDLVEIMAEAGVKVPNDSIEIPKDKKNEEQKAKYKKQVEGMAKKLWAANNKENSDNEENFNQEHRKVTLAVLTQLCDCMVWWAQRYKPSKE